VFRSIQVKPAIRKTITEKQEQGNSGRIKLKAFMKITLYKRNNRPLESTPGAIDTCEVFKRAGQQMILQPAARRQPAAKYHGGYFQRH